MRNAISEDYIGLIQKQTGNKLKVFRSDNGTEFTNSDLQKYLKERGIVMRQVQLTAQSLMAGLSVKFAL